MTTLHQSSKHDIPIYSAAFQCLGTLPRAISHDGYPKWQPNMDCCKGFREICEEGVINLIVEECSIFRVAHCCWKLLHPYWNLLAFKHIQL
jgi:hypothetical protein